MCGAAAKKRSPRKFQWDAVHPRPIPTPKFQGQRHSDKNRLIEPNNNKGPFLTQGAHKTYTREKKIHG